MSNSEIARSDLQQYKSFFDDIRSNIGDQPSLGFEDVDRKNRVFGWYISRTSKIPEMVDLLIEFTEKNGKKKKDIFLNNNKFVNTMKCGRFVQRVTNPDDPPKSFEDLVKSNKLTAYETASLLVFFFLDMLNPLLDRSKFDPVVQKEVFSKFELSENGLSMLRKDLEKLSDVHKELLGKLVTFLKGFSVKKVVKKTKMPLPKLCQTFGPCVIRGKKDNDKLRKNDDSIKNDFRVSNTLLFYIIAYFEGWGIGKKKEEEEGELE